MITEVVSHCMQNRSTAQGSRKQEKLGKLEKEVASLNPDDAKVVTSASESQKQNRQRFLRVRDGITRAPLSITAP